MKRLCAFLMLGMLAFHGEAQSINPQPTFSSAVLSADPSLYLNFNDSTASLEDQISQSSFTGTTSPTNFTLGTTVSATSGIGVNWMEFIATPSPVGSLASFTVIFDPAPTSGTVCTFAIANQSSTTSTSLTVASSFTITLSSIATTQTFTAGTNYPAVSLAQGQLFGMYSVSGCEVGQVTTGANSGGYRYAYSTTTFSSGAETYSHYLNPPTLSAVIQTVPVSVLPRQPGFDSGQTDNTSVEFPWSGYSEAPNAKLGAIDWNNPWTMMLHIDRLNWSRSGTLVLASKGDIATTSNDYWELYLQMEGDYSQLCFTRNGYGTPDTAGAPGNTTQTICTSGATLDAMPNGFNYNIAVEGLGTGAACTTSCSDLEMWINGLQVGTYLAATESGDSFGIVVVNASGGTGYANSTAFTSSGGGPNCSVTGTMVASGGVPKTSNGFSFTTNQGCTSVPTISLTSPTGTGATITVGLGGQSMNSTTYPVMVPGYVSAGTYYGVAGTNSSQTPIYVDEFAIFPSALSFTQISNIFYETKFYEGLLNTVIPPPVLVFDNDGCGDMDDQFSLQMSIALHQYGAVNLAGVVAEDPSATCEALWRQMLDQAGLNHVPLSVPTTFMSENSGTDEPVANITSYNASTPLSNTAWESAVTMYRTIFAKYPTTPIDIVSGAGMTAIAEFMESPADSISPLTGLQLMAQNAANGGAIYGQGGGCTATALPATTPCTGGIGGNLGVDYPSAQFVLTHNGALPIYWIGGTPQSAGPGVLSTRISKDPMFLITTTFGTDVRQCYDCLPVEAVVSNYFYGGVQIGTSGGTGYANSTPFTLSGGGPNCQGSGFMTASGGVPNGIEFSWGASATGSYSGLGYGCTSPPTVNLVGATGTGVTLTAYPALVCGTDTVSETGTTWGDSFSSATCSNHYVSPATAYANQTPTSGAPMEWFINSLVDPPPTGQTRTSY